MRGTILNVFTVLIGSSLGLAIGNRLEKRIQESVVTGIGLVTLFVGLSNSSETGNIIIPLLSLVSGVIVGELLRIDRRLEAFGAWLQARFQGQADTTESGGTRTASSSRFIEGYVTASLVFCIGPLTFVGSIQDGMGLPSGFEQLAIKSTLDLFTSMAFAASLGIGVLFSVITVFGLQGGLALTGWLAGEFMTDAMINEMTAVGGLILIALSLMMLDIKQSRVANFLPGIFIAPLMVAVATALGINIYPL